jgi:hypothetical protein
LVLRWQVQHRRCEDVSEEMRGRSEVEPPWLCEFVSQFRMGTLDWVDNSYNTNDCRTVVWLVGVLGGCGCNEREPGSRDASGWRVITWHGERGGGVSPKSAFFLRK